VQLGLRTGTGIVEVLEGVKAGDTVVTEGSDRLADRIPVEVVTGEGPRPGAEGPAPAAPAK
jgi:multidrug efflux pump subunit AcrA (membrane-fusion protein)